MKDNLPDLNRLAPFVSGLGKSILQEMIEDMAAIEKDRERQSVPAGWKLVPIEPSDEMIDSTYAGQHCSDIWRDMIAAAPQPQPVQPQGPMAETVQAAARDVAKCLNERDGRDLDLRHVAMLVNHAQQPVQHEPIGVVVAIRWDDSGKTTRHAASLLESAKVNAGGMLYTSPQAAQPLSDGHAKKLCAVGPVYAPNRFVERTGQEYRRELEAARLRGLRDGEQAHGITKGTT